MSRNKNVGRSAIANAGLVLQSKTEIDRTEYGMRQTTLVFNLLNEKYPELDLDRGTPCDEFTSGDALTAAVLTDLNYLGSQTSQFIRSGFAPGIGVLKVLCQGAIFDFAISSSPVIDVFLSDRGNGYTSFPSVSFTGGDEVIAATAVTLLRLAELLSPSSGGTGYTVGDIITATGGTFSRPIQLRVLAVSGGDITQTVAVDTGSYSVLPSNPVSFIGGTGSGADWTLSWKIDAIVITSGGSYNGVPVAALSGGGATRPAVVGSVVMGPRQIVPGADITKPFDPITTVKDTVEFTIYGAGGVISPVPLQARLATDSLPAYLHANPYFGDDVIFGASPGPLPIIDGRAPNVGDRILLMDGSAFAGLYRVTQIGDSVFSWFLARVAEMNESAEVTSDVYVQITDGISAAGTIWHCTVTGSFTIDVDPITFASFAATPAFVPLFRVTIDYHAIELNFEYMTAIKQPDPRFVLDEYQLDASGRIIINPATGETFGLKIADVTAIQQNVTIDPSGNVTVTDGPQVAIAEELWRQWVKYIGDAAQFQQVPAGQFWHVTETATVKMVPIPATGTIG